MTRVMKVDRHAGRAVACLLMGVIHFGAKWPVRGQDAVPRDVRSIRATDEPVPLPKRELTGVNFPLEATTEILGNLS